MVKLKKIDLPISMQDKRINSKSFYLAKINGRWYAGTFTKQWWGWNFNAVVTAGFQCNYNGWEKLYKIKEGANNA